MDKFLSYFERYKDKYNLSFDFGYCYTTKTYEICVCIQPGDRVICYRKGKNIDYITYILSDLKDWVNNHPT